MCPPLLVMTSLRPAPLTPRGLPPPLPPPFLPQQPRRHARPGRRQRAGQGLCGFFMRRARPFACGNSFISQSPMHCAQGTIHSTHTYSHTFLHTCSHTQGLPPATGIRPSVAQQSPPVAQAMSASPPPPRLMLLDNVAAFYYLDKAVRAVHVSADDFHVPQPPPQPSLQQPPHPHPHHAPPPHGISPPPAATATLAPTLHRVEACVASMVSTLCDEEEEGLCCICTKYTPPQVGSKEMSFSL